MRTLRIRVAVVTALLAGGWAVPALEAQEAQPSPPPCAPADAEAGADPAPGAPTPPTAAEPAAGGAAPTAAGGQEKLNPYTGKEEVIAEGRKLYLKANCYGCHGTLGGGGMGRALNDTDWQYGGDDRSVFETIRQGREGGMPAFKDILTEDETWKVIAYVRSFYKGDPQAIAW